MREPRQTSGNIRREHKIYLNDVELTEVQKAAHEMGMCVSQYVRHRFNAAIEIAILIPFALDVRALIGARDSRAISLSAQWQYGVYCAWWGIYFGALGQMFSMSAALFWVVAYAIKITLVVRYRSGRAA